MQTFKEESAETVELIRTTVKIVSGTEDENLALIDDDKKREIEEVASNVNEIYDIFDVSNASARRKKECEESMQQLLGSDSDIEVSGVINGVESFKIMRKHEDSEVKKLNLKYENSQKSEEKKKIGENIKNKKIFDYFFENKSKKTIKSREPLLSTIWRKGKSSLKIFKEKKEKDYLEKVESEKKNFKIDLLLNKKDDKKENKP